MPTEFSAEPKAASGNNAITFPDLRALRLILRVWIGFTFSAALLAMLFPLPSIDFGANQLPGTCPRFNRWASRTKTKLTNITIAAIALISGVTPNLIIE
jgi:hypothetical protein